MYVIVCLGGLSVHRNGSPIFSCKVYGPFETEEEAEREQGTLMLLEGPALLVRPLVDVQDTYRRISAD